MHSAFSNAGRLGRAGALVLCAVIALGCRSHAPQADPKPPAKLPSVQLSIDGKRFGTSDGKPFVAWGVNYDRDYKSRLIEEYWDDEWPTVASDFQEMKDLGANVVRIHLSVAHFMSGPDAPNAANLAQLARLVRLCEEKRIYLDVTGLGCYRRENVPAWYDQLGERGRWTVQQNFWREIASVCKDSPAVFCYDLMNEPLVAGGTRKDGDWMVGHLGDFWYCQFIILDQAGRDRAQIARQWAHEMVQAIRSVDDKHLITCGLLPNSLPTDPFYSGFDPKVVGPELDFVCIHLYPTKGKLQEDLERLKQFDVGKPVVVEEIFPLSCGTAEAMEFIDRSKSIASGWVSFYWGQTIQDLTPPKTIVDAMMLDWLKAFERQNPTTRPAIP